jgi:hypothetical protein
VRIALTIGVRMMDPMRGHPLNRAPLHGQRATSRKKILNHSWDFVAPVRQQPVIAHPDSQAAGNPIKNYGGHDALPTPEDERRQCTQMKEAQEKDIRPIDLSSLAG